MVNTQTQREQSLCVDSCFDLIFCFKFSQIFFVSLPTVCVCVFEFVCVGMQSSIMNVLCVCPPCSSTYIHITMEYVRAGLRSHWCWHQSLPQLASYPNPLLATLSLYMCVCSPRASGPHLLSCRASSSPENEREMMSWDINLKGQRENCTVQRHKDTDHNNNEL